MQQVIYRDLGQIDYKEAWDYQEELFNEVVAVKLSNRDQPASKATNTRNYLLFCEHPHVFTLGKTGSEDNLLINGRQLDDSQATFYKINRGGDITYHGPGQIVGYPILDLDNFFTDIHKYLRFLEEAVIRTLDQYGIPAGRYAGFTGVWLDPGDPAKARKICALGVRCSRWVTMHGFAFNVNSNLDYFDHIIPCGIEGKQVTSMKNELGKEVDIEAVKEVLKSHLAEIFEMELIEDTAAVKRQSV